MYKTILVHVDETARSAQRTEVAAAMALASDARLIGVATTGVPAYLFPTDGMVAAGPVDIAPLEEARGQAERSLELFEAAARRAGVASVERRCVDEDAGIAISLQSRYSDLVVISQASLDEFLPRQRSDFPDYVVLNAVGPVLVLPSAWSGAVPGTRVVVAWNGSKEAARAIASALPLLRQARQVDLVVFDPGSTRGTHGQEPGADMATCLAQHGVQVEVTVTGAGRDEDRALLAFAAAKEADLIVMGAYGRSRFSEIMLGGMTRSLLATSTIPLWMAH